MKRISDPNAVSDLNAEQALIGAALIDPVVIDQVSIAPEMFFDLRTQRAWRAMQELRLEGVDLDPITIADRIGPAVELTFLSECALSTLTATNADHYAEIVRRHALTRQVLVACSSILSLHKSGRYEGEEMLDAAMAELSKIETGKPSRARNISEVIKTRLKQLDELAGARERGELVRTGLPTGLHKLDRQIGGVQRGQIAILCGRPAMGKSAAAMAITAAVNDAGHGVHIFSLEDLEEAYADRLISRESRVPSTDIRTLQLNREAWGRITYSLPALVKRTRWLYEDVSSVSAEDIVRAVRRERHKNGTKLVVVDYLQLLLPPPGCKTRHDELRVSIETLARAAKHDGIAYLVLAQLNREIEKRKDKRPVMSDLAESGALEQRAKLILGMYRGSVYGEPQAGIDWDTETESKPSERDWRERVDIMIMKQNNGPFPMQIRMRWDGPTTRIYDPPGEDRDHE